MGYRSACAVLAGGGVECWGDNASGELGNNSTSNSWIPVPVAGLSSGVTAVSVGNASAGAITAGGGVACWGDNGSGELGNNSTVSSPVPVPVTGLSSGVTAVSVGGDSACAVAAGGGVECWGNNLFGKLGNDSTGAGSLAPVRVVGFP